jgi:hypothetical protein
MTGAGSSAPPTSNLRRWLGAALVASVLAGCNIMASGHVDFAEPPSDDAPACASALGSYSLPKAYLHIQVGLVPNVISVPDILVAKATDPAVQVLYHPDPSLVFCIDYLRSSLFHDIITVRKAPKTSFLGAVMVNATDESVYIIESLLRAGFIVASGSSTFAPRSTVIAGAPQILADLEYDPFNPEESTEVNVRLSALGFCVVLEDYTFDRRIGIDQYCNAPSRYGQRPVLITKAYMKAEATPADPHLPGLLYRPRVPYRLEIFHKADPKGTGPWQLYEMDSVTLENLSPVLSLDISRAAFANRTANFVFAQGALATACVSKGSELLGFSDIPLQIAKSIVALPAAIVSVRVDQINSQKNLVTAQQQLVQVQNAYVAALSGNSYQQVSGVQTNTAPPAFAPQPTSTPIAPPDATQIYGKDLLSGDLNAACNKTPS